MKGFEMFLWKKLQNSTATKTSLKKEEKTRMIILYYFCYYLLKTPEHFDKDNYSW